MSLFFAPREARAISVDAFFDQIAGASRTTSGVSVTPGNALKMGAQWASAHLLASIVSNLPVDVFNGSRVTKAEVSPQPPLVASPSLLVSRREWLYQGMMSMLIRGNAYGFVLERDRLDRPTVIEWLNPDHVKVKQRSSLAAPTYEVGGELIPRDKIAHLPAFVQPGSAIGLSPVEYHAETIGMGLAAQKHGAKWFGDGAHPTAILKGDVADAEAAQTVKDRFLAVLKGKREPLVLGKGWEYVPLQASAAESEFIASMGYSDAQVARMYGPGLAEVLGYQTSGSSLTYSNRVDRSLDLLTYTVLPWVNKWEDFLTASVGAPNVVKLNTNSLLRADNKARFDAYKVGIDSGFLSDDEARELEDRPPLELSTQDALAKYAEPLGSLVRAGFEPAAALEALGLDPIAHTGLVPITVASPKNPKIGGEPDVISA